MTHPEQQWRDSDRSRPGGPPARPGTPPTWYLGQPVNPRPGPQVGPFPPFGMAGMRASTADRERTVDVLKAGFTEGRLTPEEFEQRVGLAQSAVTYDELGRLVADLPQGPLAPPVFLPPQPVVPFPAVYRPQVTPRPTNPLAIGALICGLFAPLGGVTGVPAVVLGHLARSATRKSGDDGAGIATFGLVMGWIGIGLWAWLWVLGGIF